MMIFKVAKNFFFTLSSDSIFFEYSLALGPGFFLNETSVLAFAGLAIFLF